MRTTTTAVLAAVAAIPFTFLAAGPASAAPGDITAVFTTTVNPDGLSNTVTGTFTATGSNQPFYCEMVDFALGGGNSSNLLRGVVYGGDPTPSLTATDTDVPDGTYSVNWFCWLADEGSDGTADFGAAGDSAPTTLVVPAVVPEEPETPNCTGSVCLPTGSVFGF